MGLISVPEGLGRDAKMLLAMATAGGLFGGSIGYVIQLYLKAVGFDSRAIGLMFTANVVCSAVFAIPFGIIGDRFGRRNAMIVGGLAYDLFIVLLLTTRSFPLLLIAFGLMGLGNSSFSVLMQPLYASYFRNEEMDKAFSLMGFLNLASSAAGSLLGYIPPALMSWYGLSLARAYWSLMAGGAMLLVVISTLLVMVKPDRPNAQGFSFRLESKGVMLRFGALNALLGLGAGMFIELFTYFLSVKFSVESAAIGIMFFATSVVAALANLAAHRISRRFGAFGGILTCLGLTLPLHLGTVLAPAYPLAAASYVARSGFINIYMTLVGSLMMKMTKDEERATVSSVATIAHMLPRGAGSALGGMLMATSLNLPGYVSIALYAATAASFYLMFKGQTEREA